MKKLIIAAAIAAAPWAAVAQDAPDYAAQVAELGGDAKSGEKVFRKCKACHFADKDKNKTGPHLVGVVGRPAASVESFTKYSDAMKESGLTWDVETLSGYLEKPKKFLPKNKMAFAGLKKEQDRKDVIAYLAESGIYKKPE